MKIFFTVSCLVICVACAQQNAADKKIIAALDSLKQQILQLQKEKYKPGLGEIMASIQMHHAKLWYAGTNNNWKLSAFEIDEIREMLTTAKEIETDRPETKDLPMIYPPIDSIALAIQSQNPVAFKKSFLLLTNTCNSCHSANHFAFNVITVPSSPPVSNQDFKAH
jgi:cytochrome c1